MGNLGDLRDVLGASVDHAKNLNKEMRELDQNARSLNSIQTAKQSDSLGNTPGFGGIGSLNPNGTTTTNLGNTVGVAGTGQSGVAGTAGSAGKSNDVRTIAYLGADGNPTAKNVGQIIGVFDENGVYIKGSPRFREDGSFITVEDADGNDILHVNTAAGGRSSGSPTAPSGGAGKSAGPGLGPGKFSSPPPTTTSSGTPGGGGGGVVGVSAGDKAIISAIEGLRMDLGGKTPLGTLVRTR